MPTHLSIDVVLRDGEWADSITDPIRHAHIERVGLLPSGTTSGAPAFEVLARTSDGGTVLLETTWAAMRTAFKALEAGWPDGLHHLSEAPAQTELDRSGADEAVAAAERRAGVEPSELAVFTAGWLAGLALREDRVVEPGNPDLTSFRLRAASGRVVLVHVMEVDQ